MKKILLIGEECQDIYHYGRVERFCPEAPCPVFLPVSTKTNRGMAGNVHENLLNIIQKTEYEIEVYTHLNNDRPKKERYIDQKTNHFFMRIDKEDAIKPSENIWDTSCEYYDIVVVSDYNKGFLSEAALIHIANQAKFSIIDTKKSITKQLADAFDLIKVNEKEYNRNAEILANRDNVIITLGQDGMRFRGEIYDQPKKQNTHDISGCGDTVLASLAVSLCEGFPIEDAIATANREAGIVANKRGVCVPYDI